MSAKRSSLAIPFSLEIHFWQRSLEAVAQFAAADSCGDIAEDN
jgi:hypothetical protein